MADDYSNLVRLIADVLAPKEMSKNENNHTKNVNQKSSKRDKHNSEVRTNNVQREN
jgi:hypothetical protein